MKTATDYTALPDGVTLVLADGRKFVKGNHHNHAHMKGTPEAPLVYSFPGTGLWCNAKADGTVLAHIAANWAVVGWEIPKDFDWTRVPEGWTLICKNGTRYTKTDKPDWKASGPVAGKRDVGKQSWAADGSCYHASNYNLVDFEPPSSPCQEPAPAKPKSKVPEAKPLTTENVAQVMQELVDATCGIPKLYPVPADFIGTLQGNIVNQTASTYISYASFGANHAAGPIDVQTRTFVNGMDIAGLPNARIYQLIADQEAEIKRLEQIENKPKMLQREIEDRLAGINKLVAYLDSVENGAKADAPAA